MAENKDQAPISRALLFHAIGLNHAALEIIDDCAKTFGYYQSKASIQLSAGLYDECMKTLVEMVDNIQDLSQTQQFYLHYTRAQCCFKNNDVQGAMGQCTKAKTALKSCDSLAVSKEGGQLLAVLINKVQAELGNSTGNINDGVYLKSSKEVKQEAIEKEIEKEEQKQEVQQNEEVQQEVEKPVVSKPTKKMEIRQNYDWYQNNEYAFISFMATDESVIQETNVDLQEQSFTLTYGEQKIEINLANTIVVADSMIQKRAKKIEIKLKKEQTGLQWLGLTQGAKPTLMAHTNISKTTEKKPSYPTSSKKAKDWSAIDKQIEKDFEKEKPEGDEALNGLFKQIYEKADPETRRAMIKSYQTSGGTVLSTNWGEVENKDYEGKDRPDAPNGQRWLKKEEL